MKNEYNNKNDIDTRKKIVVIKIRKSLPKAVPVTLLKNKISAVIPNWVMQEFFPKLTGAELACILVLYRFADKKGVSWPGQKRIALYAGLSIGEIKLVFKRLHTDENIKFFNRNKKATGKKGYFRYEYRITKSRLKEGKPIYISAKFFDLMNWANLPGIGKKLYIQMRLKANWDPFIEDDFNNDPEYSKEQYKNRIGDLLLINSINKTEYCKKAKISRNSYKQAVEYMEVTGFLIEREIDGELYYLFPRLPQISFP